MRRIYIFLIIMIIIGFMFYLLQLILSVPASYQSKAKTTSSTITPTSSSALIIRLKLAFQGVKAISTTHRIRIPIMISLLTTKNKVVKSSIIYMNVDTKGTTNGSLTFRQPAGRYHLAIKGSKHLRTVFTGISLKQGTNILDFSNKEIPLLVPSTAPIDFSTLPEQPRLSAKSNVSSSEVFRQRVFLLTFDPFLPKKNAKLSSLLYFKISPRKASEWLIKNFKLFTDNHVIFDIVKEKEVNDFPPRKTGEKHTEDTFYQCETNPQSLSYCEADADWEGIIKTYNICEMVNNNEIDEVWLWAPPRAGFWESALIGPSDYYNETIIGPNGFSYNGPILSNNSCNKYIPIMGFNYDRADQAMHNMGHRMEATMSHVYGRWQGNVENPNNWEQFGMTYFESPSFPGSGCGSIHFTPNAKNVDDGYKYNNRFTYPSFCDSFYTYPNINRSITKQTSCEDWQCNEQGYYQWWFKHIPFKDGIDAKGKLQNWWEYFLFPEKAK